MIVKEMLLIHVSAETEKSIADSSGGDVSNAFAVLSYLGDAFEDDQHGHMRPGHL